MGAVNPKDEKKDHLTKSSWSNQLKQAFFIPVYGLPPSKVLFEGSVKRQGLYSSVVGSLQMGDLAGKISRVTGA